MGIVVAARDLREDQRVALKILRPVERMDLAVARATREARALAQLDSEFVCRFIDDGWHESVPFLVMELLEGRSLDAELETRGALDPSEAAEYVLQACVGLAEAHATGFVHRDLKTANLFLVDQPGGRHVKVLDFGIAGLARHVREQEARLTVSGHFLGTPYCMSPEQARNPKTADERTDVWALGVVLYELVTGQRPFASGTVSQVLASILMDRPRPLRDRRADVPEPLDALVFRCLERDRTKRIQSMAHLAAGLAPLVRPEERGLAQRAAHVLSSTST